MVFPSAKCDGSITARSQARRGAAVIEFALVVPILFVIVVGMAELTRAVQVQAYLSDAARSACRIAIQDDRPGQPSVPRTTNQQVNDNIYQNLKNNGIDPAAANAQWGIQ